jgi:dTDP-4-amino-4,6-dideoxygalactose transaminase
METIPINMPQIDEQEIEMVTQVLKSRFLTSHPANGPMVTKFESAFANFVNAKHAIAVNNGTAALQMALLAAGINPGDEVIVPSFTFVATAEAVALVGAKPVFVDIDPNTYNINPEKAEKSITSRTRAMIPVDLYGLSADVKAIAEIAEKHDLALIEDAAQAHGALYKGKPPGAFADMACWSFYASKNMTTGEGGMITTNSDEFAEKLRSIRMHGEKESYVSSMLGSNYRMPEIEAAIGCVQLQKLPKFLEKRRKNAELLTEKLGKAEGLQLPGEPPGYKHSWYLYTVRLKGRNANARNRVLEELRKSGVGAAVYYGTPIHLMPYYRKFGKYSLPETEKAAQQVFSLPVHPGVTSSQIEHIATSTVKALSKWQ